MRTRESALHALGGHIKMLERAGMVRRTVVGHTHLCRLDPRPMHAGLEWLRFYERFWNQRPPQRKKGRMR
ncbi:hypothetical protein [Archangium sp.]|uniref:hypothetical protein n=1 Tax=Archangium sp. TaxID=1872627 RepID=UPI002D51CA06|nr:hypothetical protein [Archangium sp.]HYO51867.1 hypothetical protein [Archangium sp.]